jgi:hypothetical protein
MGTSLTFSVPQFSHLYNIDKNTITYLKILWESMMPYIKHLKMWCLHRKASRSFYKLWVVTLLMDDKLSSPYIGFKPLSNVFWFLGGIPYCLCKHLGLLFLIWKTQATSVYSTSNTAWQLSHGHYTHLGKWRRYTTIKGIFLDCTLQTKPIILKCPSKLNGDDWGQRGMNELM